MVPSTFPSADSACRSVQPVSFGQSCGHRPSGRCGKIVGDIVYALSLLKSFEGAVIVVLSEKILVLNHDDNQIDKQIENFSLSSLSPSFSPAPITVALLLTAVLFDFID